jgi:hypothetical protein
MPREDQVYMQLHQFFFVGMVQVILSFNCTVNEYRLMLTVAFHVDDL